MAQPTHDGLGLVQDLHAIDAEIEIVLAGVARSLGHDQRPSDQGRRFVRPAGLNRQPGKIDVGAIEHDLLTGRAAHRFGLHRHECLGERQHLEGFADAARRLGLTQCRQQLSDLAQGFRVAAFHAAQGHGHRHALHRTEQIDQHRDGGPRAIGLDGVLEDDGGPAFRQKPRLDFRHFQHGRDRRGDAHQLALGFESGEEFSQGPIVHGGEPSVVNLKFLRSPWHPRLGTSNSRTTLGPIDR